MSRAVSWSALGLAWLVHAALVGRFWFVTDDAYISFRYARNWASGLGLRYNVGEHVPVEGFSNFAWVALASLVDLSGADTVRVMPLLSAACGTALLLLVYRALRLRFSFDGETSLSATLALACCTPFAVWSTGGLETMSFALLLFLAVDRIVLAPGGGLARGVAGGGLLALVALSRPEGVYWAVLVLVLGFACRRGESPGSARFLRVGALTLAVVFGAFTAWRIGYFGHFLSSSSTAKLAAGVRPDRIARGLEYLAIQLLTTLSLVAIVPGCVVALRRGARGMSVAVLALAFPVWSVLVSGDFMAFGRFLVPGLAFGAIAWAHLLDRVRTRSKRASRIGALSLVVLGLLPAFDLSVVPSSARSALDFREQLGGYRSEYQYWRRQDVETRRWASRGRALAAIARPGESIALSAIGAVGYHSGLFVHDQLGLVTREVAEEPPPEDVRDRMPGHDNPVDFRWFLARGIRPTFVRANFHGAADTDELLGKVNHSLDVLAGGRLDAEYSLDVIAVEGEETEEGGRYLFVWRLLPQGADPARVRERLLRRVTEGTLETVAPL